MVDETLRNQYRFIQRMFVHPQWPKIAAPIVAILLGLLYVWLPLRSATGLVVGIAVVLLIIIQPLFGLALALLAGPLGALEQLLSGIVSLDSGQVLLILTLLSWLGHGMVRKRVEVPQTFLNLPLLLFALIGFISLLDATSVVVGFREMLKWVEIVAIMLLVVDLGREGVRRPDVTHARSIIGGPPRTIWIVSMLLLAGLSQALIGIWQFGFRGDGPEHFIVLDRFYRAYGTYEQPNPFGGFMNLTVLLALGVLVGLLAAWWAWLRHRQGSGPNRAFFSASWRGFWVTVLAALAVAITGLALLFSWSRGAWLGFASGAAVMLLFLPRKRFQGVMLVGVLAGMVLLAYSSGLLPDAVSARLTSFTEDFTVGDVRGEDINDENYSVLERQAHWQAGLDMLRDDLLLGVGFGNYSEAYSDYALINWPDALGHAHNYYINLLAEVGVLGFVAYVLLWMAVLWQTLRILRLLAWPDRGIALGLLAVWIALATHHLVDKLYVNNIYIHLGVMLGLLQLLDWYTVKVNQETKV